MQKQIQPELFQTSKASALFLDYGDTASACNQLIPVFQKVDQIGGLTVMSK